MHNTRRKLLTATLSFATLALLAASPAPEPAPEPAALADSIEAFLVLLEKDDAPAAAERWAGGADAAKAIKQHWPRLRECHKEFDYRKWEDGSHEPGAAGAASMGDATKFTVGGHAYGHLHTDWTKTTGGWRVTGVWLCR